MKCTNEGRGQEYTSQLLGDVTHIHHKKRNLSPWDPFTKNCMQARLGLLLTHLGEEERIRGIVIDLVLRAWDQNDFCLFLVKNDYQFACFEI